MASVRVVVLGAVILGVLCSHGCKSPSSKVSQTQQVNDDAAVKAAISQHEKFAVCKMFNVNFGHMGKRGPCVRSISECDNYAVVSSFSALNALKKAGYITGALPYGRGDETFWSTTSKAEKAKGTVITERRLSGKMPIEHFGYADRMGWEVTLGCREFDQIDATTPLNDGVKVDFSWHWAPNDIGEAAGLESSRQRGVAYLTRKDSGLAIDQLQF